MFSSSLMHETFFKSLKKYYKFEHERVLERNVFFSIEVEKKEV